MPAFEYTAVDKQGKKRKGVLEGDAQRQIRQQLRDQDLIPLSVDEVNQKSTQRRSRAIKMGAADLALVTRQLATLVRSGLALEEALRAIAEQSSRSKTLLLAVRSRVLEGHSLAEGLGDYPNIFPQLYRATVAAGEQTGHLDIVLERLAEYTEQRQYLRQKTLLALFYPLLLTSVAILVVVGLLAYVVPQVVQVFANINQNLPFLTRNLIIVSDFLRDWGLVLLILLGLLAAGFRYLLQFERFINLFHHFLLRVPVVSRLERNTNVVRFTRTLSILLQSGVPILKALDITAQVISNYPMRTALQKASEQVRQGSSLHHALEQSGLFPPMTVYLIASGENSGNLEQMLERAAIMQERELETVIGVLLSLFEPILILVMGSVVLVIVLAILMPIFELNQLIQ